MPVSNAIRLFCGKCRNLKSSSEFNLAKVTSKDKRGYQRYCRQCMKDHAIDQRKKRKDNGTAEEFERMSYKRWHRPAKLKRVFGISQEEYDTLLEKQGGLCAICRGPETQRYRGALMCLAVDHDHGTKKVRGLLCKSCNLAIGKFKESIDIVRRALQYLENSAQ